MSDKATVDRKMPFLKDPVDQSPVLQEVRLRESRKNLIRKETLILEPKVEQALAKVTRLDDPSKPWYITHV